MPIDGTARLTIRSRSSLSPDNRTRDRGTPVRAIAISMASIGTLLLALRITAPVRSKHCTNKPWMFGSSPRSGGPDFESPFGGGRNPGLATPQLPEATLPSGSARRLTNDASDDRTSPSRRCDVTR